jgi:hypothetical protein
MDCLQRPVRLQVSRGILFESVERIGRNAFPYFAQRPFPLSFTNSNSGERIVTLLSKSSAEKAVPS